jgi:hypothetical protein
MGTPVGVTRRFEAYISNYPMQTFIHAEACIGK